MVVMSKHPVRKSFRIKHDLINDLSQPVVYAAVAPIVSGTKFVKVGWSGGLLSRLASIQTGCPVPITDVSYVRTWTPESARSIEAAIHLLMAECRSQGEWFKFDLADERQRKIWRGAIPAVLNEAFGKGRWEIKTFNYSRALCSRKAA